MLLNMKVQAADQRLAELEAENARLRATLAKAAEREVEQEALQVAEMNTVRGDAAATVLARQDELASKISALAALIELGDRLREPRHPGEIAYAAAEIVGRTLRTDRAGYGIVDEVAQTIRIDRDWTAGQLPSLTGVFNLAEHWTGFADALRRGEVVAVHDVLSDPRIGASAAHFAAVDVRACLHAPWVEAGRVTTVLYAHSAAPRRWTAEEIAFVRGVAERAWAAAERARGERRHELLLAELNHRVKNILATVQGLAAQTLKGVGGDPRRFAEHFGARLRTLARAHDMLTEHGWEPASFEASLRTALAPWLEGGRAVQIEMPSNARDIMVAPRQAQALVLAFHELATNALKYGALSTPAGRVSVRCGTGTGGAVALHWKEVGGPPVVRPPDRRGFGTRLLERGLAQDLGPGSTVQLHFERVGLQAEVRFVPVPERG